jgi:hypothetical protein
MSLKKRLFVAICGVTLCVGAANAQVVVRVGPRRRSLLNARPRFACGMGMDTRILPLDRKTICLGFWALGGATPASRNLGSRPMGSSRWWLGLHQRILALEGRDGTSVTSCRIRHLLRGATP